MPATDRPAYFTAFPNLALSRTPSGVVTARFHTDNGPATFTGRSEGTQLGMALEGLTAADLAHQG